MFRQNLKRGIRYKFLRDMSLILIAGSCILSAVIALTERNTLRESLMTKGLSFASYIAKLSQDPLIMRDSLQLDAIVNEANKDAEILYAVIEDTHGNIVTSQYSSINYQSPRVKELLADISKENSFEDIIASIKNKESSADLSVPIVTGSDIIGRVTICLSEHNIRKRMVNTIFFVMGLNLAIMILCGLVLFISSRKTILDPIIELGHASDNLARGDLSTRADVSSEGEIGMLVKSFNRMAEDLEKTTVSKKTLQTILDSMPYGVVMVDRAERKIISINDAAMELIGYNADEQLTGMACDTTLCPGEEDMCPLFDSDPGIVRSEKFITTKDGGRIPVFRTIVPLTIDGKDVLLEAIVDITDLKRAEEELKILHASLLQHDKMASIGQLAAGVAHEINNPAGFVLSNMESLRRYSAKLMEFVRIQSVVISGLPPENVAVIQERAKALQIDYICSDMDNLLAESLEGMERIKKIVQDLKGFSHVDETDSRMADINEGLESTLNIVWNELKYKATVRKEFGEIPKTLCNPGKLNQVFMNLLLNSADAIETTGKIGVRTWSKEGNIYIAISDTGCGIPADIKNRIFDPFYTTKEVGKGTGLGLSIAYDIIEKHKGDIRIESEVGKGSTFTIRIPVVKIK
jgi:PAS domain S-box-containing protein